MSKENLIHYRTSVCNIHYHVVWSVKYRKPVLTHEVECFLKSVISDIASEKGFIVELCEVGDMNHVHCFITAPPKLSVTNIMKWLKGISGRKLYMQFPELVSSLYHGELWNHSYYCETIGSVSEENIRRYIENQSKGY